MQASFHRGYPIAQLAEHSDYLETMLFATFMWELPDKEQK